MRWDDHDSRIKTSTETQRFYRSDEWKKMRNKMRQSLKNSCVVCQTEKNLVVDHIKPLRFFWEERLSEENLQILCHNCNLEKESMIDWSVEYHRENKANLEQYRKDKTELFNSINEVKRVDDLMKYLPRHEKDLISSAWSVYCNIVKRSMVDGISKYDFINYLKHNVLDFKKASKYVKDNWQEFKPIENKQIKDKNKKILRRVTKDGQIIEYKIGSN
jgi:5-methylcytosine-specific restriction endonuclease McrA